MKRFIFLPLAILLLALPKAMSATSIFDTFFDEAAGVRVSADPGNQIKQFVADEMRRWHHQGIALTTKDIDAAIEQKTWTKEGDGLCQGKVDIVAAEPLSFSQESCEGLRQEILSLIAAEREAEQLGDDLLSAVNASELAAADEPHRPIPMGTISLLLRRVWSGTDAGIVPWDGSADAKVAALEAALNGMDPEQLDAVILRFHHGYFRDKHEADPRFASIGVPVGDALRQIAETLLITGDPNAQGEFAVPALKTQNVALWARKDDLGLQWVIPTHFARLTINEADRYPVIPEGTEVKNLAYPFEYEGQLSIDPPVFASPLCSRTVGRFGYLCRRMPVPVAACRNTDPGSISLVECSNDTTETVGPSVCEGLKNLYTDDGKPLVLPEDPGHLNPELTPADKKKICSPPQGTIPGAKILYADDISSHACYVAACLAESMSGHSLVPGRNTVVINESASPYLACMRADPQLGLYAETAEKSPFPLPPYLGHLLVRNFEREYCLKNGDAPRAVLGDCAFRTDRVGNAPPQHQPDALQQILTDAATVGQNQETFLSLAPLIGQRLALEQTLLVDRKLFASVGQFIRQMADLLTELKRAPLTTVACPWTGPFKTFGT